MKGVETMKSFMKKLLAFGVAGILCFSTVTSVSIADTAGSFGAGMQKQADLRVEGITVVGKKDNKDKNNQTIAANDEVIVTVAVTGADWGNVEKVQASLVKTWAVTGWNSNIVFALQKDKTQQGKFVSTVAVSGVEKGEKYFIMARALDKADKIIEFSVPLSQEKTPSITIAKDNPDNPSNPGSGGSTDKPSNPGGGGNTDNPSNPGGGGNTGTPGNPGGGGNTGTPGNPGGGGSTDKPGSGTGSGNKPSGSTIVSNNFNDGNTAERHYESGYKAFADGFKNNYMYSPAFGSYYYDGYFASKEYQNKIADYKDMYAETYASNFDAYVDAPVTGVEMANWGLPGNAGRLAYNITRGIVSSQRGVLTKTAFPFPSRWERVGDNWMFRYTNGTYAKGQAVFNERGLKAVVYDWEFIDGNWYAFDEYGYLGIGWIYDIAEQSWYYIEQSKGTLSGWQQIDGQWYYFEPTTNASNGKMLTDTWIGGNYVNENGVWVP